MADTFIPIRGMYCCSDGSGEYVNHSDYKALEKDFDIMTSTSGQLQDAVDRITKENASLRAKIDALMFEYCPEDMAIDQIAEYGSHQKPVICDLRDVQWSDAQNEITEQSAKIARLEHYIKTTGNLGDKPQWIRDLFHESNSESLAEIKKEAILEMTSSEDCDDYMWITDIENYANSLTTHQNITDYANDRENENAQ